ncbi:L-fucose/L-arabinose isomerase family protein [Pyrofollis japonicus]|nr:L-fucose/L-arabinose isomerase family protein [Pyrofollis japonicus]
MLALRDRAKSPMLVIAHPYANSLPAVLEAAPILRDAGKTAIIYVSDFDDKGLLAISQGLRILRSLAKLQGARLGIIGGISPWLVYSKLTAENANKLGIQLISIDMNEFLAFYQDAKEPEDLVKRLVQNASSIRVTRDEVAKALKVYVALKSLIDRYGLDALTIKCFDLIENIRTTACLALSLLNSEGFVAGCEGDVPSTVSMMILSAISGKPVFMANPARIEDNMAVFAHCTSPIMLGQQYSLLTHFESGIGVGVSVKMAPGEPVTILRLDPSTLKLRIMRGTIIESGLLSNLHCRTQVKVRLRNPRIIIEKSIGNHYVMTIGDYTESLTIAAQLLGIEYEVIV